MSPHKPIPPRMQPYAKRYPRNYLHQEEVLKLIKSAYFNSRQGTRNALLIWLMYRHGLRISEAVDLHWQDLDMENRMIHVRRLKNGTDDSHRMKVSEYSLFVALRSKAIDYLGPIFVSERGEQLTAAGARAIIKRAHAKAGISVPMHSHMLRHACGYHLINVQQKDIRKVQEWLGHKDIRHTVNYTKLDEFKFDYLWDDALEDLFEQPKR